MDFKRHPGWGVFAFGGQGTAEWGFRGHGLLGLDCQIQAKNGEARLVAFILFGCRIWRSGRSRWNGLTLKPFETRPPGCARFEFFFGQ